MTIFDAKAEKIFLKYLASAERDIAEAQDYVAIFYYYGTGVEPNKILAYKWFIIYRTNPYFSSAMLKEVSKNVGTALTKDNITKEMSLEEIAEAEKLANDWIKENR